jgi:hypothetical protein
MVCDRCIKAVITILCELKIDHGSVLLGEVKMHNDLSEDQAKRLQERFHNEGFELIDDKKNTDH